MNGLSIFVSCFVYSILASTKIGIVDSSIIYFKMNNKNKITTH